MHPIHAIALALAAFSGLSPAAAAPLRAGLSSEARRASAGGPKTHEEAIAHAVAQTKSTSQYDEQFKQASRYSGPSVSGQGEEWKTVNYETALKQYNDHHEQVNKRHKYTKDGEHMKGQYSADSNKRRKLN
ncbi:hypothetical protein CALCODRAFT_554101 [Calocera cornea HHB12733]|uniref:Uncharacterized protein n=1 Tax=Calocera cornea HHB12733 TaxID=1353952 RepID=A0A165HR69_9BASI|nr:hypothetical protein CALCODRAFT_554101 [Calocera cornea HHB12733]